MRPRDARSEALEGLRCECSALWLERGMYQRAETLYHLQLQEHRQKTPRSLPLPPCDEGYQSQTPTPPTPAPRPINGLPALPPPLMGVWLQKPAFDRAEAAFYQNRCRTLAPPWQTGSAHGERNGKKMAALGCLALDGIWFEKSRYDEAERQFYERNIGTTKAQKDTGANSILKDIAKARENIQKSLAGLKTNPQPHRGPSPKPSNPSPSVAPDDHSDLLRRVKELEQQNVGLQRVVEELRSSLSKMEVRVSALEQRPPPPAVNGTSRHHEEEEEEELDLFGSDEEEDEEAERVKQQRLQEYTARKAKKPTLIAKSSILLDVKPWDDETDMAQLEVCVRSLRVDGLLWGASRLVPVGYGIKKLQISCVVEDDKVGTDFLEEEITKFEEHVQSVDVAAFNKI